MTTTAPLLILGTNPRAAALAATLTAAGRTTVSFGPEQLPRLARQFGLEDTRLILLCEESPEAAEAALAALPAPLARRDLVNLTSGTGAQAERAAARATARGANYLQGALMAHPEHVGDPATVLVYGGSGEVFARNEAELRLLGDATYLGPAVGVVPLYDLALLNLAWATLVGFLQTAALLGTAGVTARSVVPLLTRWLGTTVADVIGGYAAQVDEGHFPGDGEWLELDAPLMEHLREATEAHGLDAGLPLLVQSLTARGVAAGHGRASFASLIEVIRAPVTTHPPKPP
ncbi:NAD(P)-dependent oxidoreductase [Streptomyces sp. DSM 44915]|uniref:NAD(P)-dependent oxidoreductase n=1 Tax=Streptomyces chisholmiae TaxID=3075540 RepID=A0ABU2JSR1_9ACTN|nr:NAD(P)-dependent oxidoreductase [Streptomyces sp. DSM 44915]MDT0268010.1 NAD(P)-dependent oxidoreductase [Streptomyces sp. DSM 44915]